MLQAQDEALILAAQTGCILDATAMLMRGADNEAKDSNVRTAWLHEDCMHELYYLYKSALSKTSTFHQLLNIEMEI